MFYKDDALKMVRILTLESLRKNVQLKMAAMVTNLVVLNRR